MNVEMKYMDNCACLCITIQTVIIYTIFFFIAKNNYDTNIIGPIWFSIGPDHFVFSLQRTKYDFNSLLYNDRVSLGHALSSYE